MKELLHIGTIEFVSLPDDQIFDVPAKIDTGADNSAIWASNIHMAGGKLTFSFFAPGSAFYTGQKIVTSAFRNATIRNSFGHKETRYKIQLRVQIGDQTLRRWFTLADRSNNTYPILLGKNLLKNKFIVNVAHKYLVSGDQGPINILVLGAQSKPSRDFFKQVSKQNKESINYNCVGYQSLVYHIDNQHQTRVLNTADGDTDVADYDFTYFKTHQLHAEQAAAAAEYLHFRGRPFVDSEVGHGASASKLSSYMKLACFGIPIPPTTVASGLQLRDRFDEIVEHYGMPFVLKEVASDRGKNNYLITKQADFKRILREAPAHYIFAAQRYIENDGFYRVYIMGRQAQMVIWRSAHPHEDALKRHLNKPAGSANAKLLTNDDLPSEAHDIAARAAQCLNREIAGVDILQDKQSRTWYVLEVNNAPQLRSGSFLAEKTAMVARFFDKEVL